MKHCGDITKMRGATSEPVNIVTFGSPCQDMSIAGKQLGLQGGERSVLFYQAVRIINEMRAATNGLYPDVAVWENVPGAYSSNGGKDFRSVLEALARVSEPEVSIPMPESRWQTAGEIIGDGWSIAWRTLDAQYWGVPQRRKRIYLVADFSGERASEILFECESVCGNIAQSGEARKGVAADAERSVGGSAGFGETGIGYWQNGIQCLRAEGENRPSRPSNVVVYPLNTQIITRSEKLGRGTGFGAGDNGDPAYTLQEAHGHAVCYAVQTAQANKNGLGARAGEAYTLNCANDQAVCYSADCRNLCLNEELSGTLQAKNNGGQSLNYVNPVVYENHGQDSRITECEDTAPTVAAKYGTGGNNTPIVMQQTYQDKSGALCANSHPGSYTGQDAYNDMLIAGASPNPPRKYIVRRLMPVECARLQGFPDWWGDIGKPHSDSAEYKMWGNGIALPCAEFVIGRIAKVEEEKP